MPQDEIMARLLFGKSLDQITPLQALQIASSLRSMRAGQSLDFMQKIQQKLGVDQIKWSNENDTGTGEGTQSVLSLGKYITDNLYTELHKTMSSDGKTSVTLEYEIHPNLTLETEAGMNMRPGIGINWKYDY